MKLSENGVTISSCSKEEEMRKALTTLLAHFLFATGIVAPVTTESVQLDTTPIVITQDELENVPSTHPQLSVGNRTELSGFLSKEEFVDALGADKKIRVVVELTKDPVIVAATKKGVAIEDLAESEVQSIQKELTEQQDLVKATMKRKNINSDVKDESTLEANDSFTVSVNAFTTYIAAGDLDELSKLPGVKEVYISNEYERPNAKIDMDTSLGMVGAEIAWNTNGFKGEGTVVAVIDSGFDSSHKDFNITDPSKVSLTKEFVDSLGLAGRYYNAKIPYAYNYYDLSQKVMDISTSGHHGQHVAGTVAANGQIKGVAPEAQVLGLKVFSDDADYATTFSDVYLKAIDDAITLGADVINMSLGSPAGFYVDGSIEDVALKNAQENGVVSTISAGNEGHIMTNSVNQSNYLSLGLPYPQAKNPDIGLVGSPSLTEASISIASVENLYSTVSKLDYEVNGEAFEAAMTQAVGSPNPWELLSGAQEIVPVGIGTAADFAQVGNAVKGKVALAMRGNTFTDTLENATNAGATGVIVYNHTTGGEDMVSMAGGDGAKIAYVFIGNKAGSALAEAFNAGQSATVTFTSEMMQALNQQGGNISSFSSWGTTPNLAIKPELSAPGGMIYSTQNNDTYSTMSGTSMAAPHAAGGAALVQQRLKTDALFEGLSANDRALLSKTLLMNTATTLLDDYGYPFLVRQQGAGIMNLAGALSTEVYVVEKETGKPKVEFLDTTSTTLRTTLTLTNLSDQDVTYETSSVMLTDYVAPYQNWKLNILSSDFVSHSLDVESVTVPANGSVDVTFTLDYSGSGLPENSFVEGFIYFSDENDALATLNVPYLAFYGDWDGLNVLDEFRWNRLDADPTNDPTLLLTTLINPASNGDLYFVNHLQDVWINPQNPMSKVYGSGSVGLLASVFRNIETANFRVLDESGEVVREIGQHTNIRKEFRMGTVVPYTFFTNGVWDGTLDGHPVNDGETYTYQVEFLRTKDSSPQVLEFELKVDNTGPAVSNVEYDADTYTLSFDASDALSGVDYFVIESAVDSGKYITAEDTPELVGKEGEARYSVNVQSILENESQTRFYIYGYDKAGSISALITGAVDPLRPEDVVPTEPAPEPEPNPDVERFTVTGDVVVDGQKVDPLTIQGSLVVLFYSDLTNYIVGSVTEDGLVFNDVPEGAYLPFVQGLPGGLEYLQGNLIPINEANTNVTLSLATKNTGPYGQGQISIANPGLLGAYNTSDIKVSGSVYGWKEAVSLKVGDRDVKLVKNEFTSIFDANNTEIFFGNVYSFDQILTFEDGYHELPFIATNHEDVSAQVVRRFWVDTEKPSIEVSVAERDSNANTATITIKTSDNMGVVELYRGDNFVNAHDWTNKGYNTRNVQGEDTDVVKLKDGVNTFTYTVEDIAGNKTSATVQVVKEDLASEANSPSFYGVGDATVYVGDVVDLLDGVSATDVQDGDLTAKIIVTPSEVDTSRVGETKVTYSVTDSHNNTTTQEVTITVIEKPATEANKAQLRLTIEEAEKALVDADLTPAQRNRVEEALEVAKTLLEDADATQKAVVEAVETLLDALDPSAPINQAPVITGVLSRNVYQNTTVDVLEGVSATDAQDGDLTDKITATPATVDTSKVGSTTTVTYVVVDSDGNETIQEASFTVIAKNVVENIGDLKDKLNEAKALDTKAVKQLLVLDLEAAIKRAEAVLASANPSQELVDLALKQLESAITNIKNASVPPIGELKDNESVLNTDVGVIVGEFDADVTAVITKLPNQYAGYIGQAYEIKLVSGDKEVQPGSPVTVYLKLDSLVNGEDAKLYSVVNGQLHEHPSEVNDGYVVFTTDHFSTWFVGHQITGDTLPSSGHGGTMITTLTSMALISAGIWIVLKRRNKHISS